MVETLNPIEKARYKNWLPEDIAAAAAGSGHGGVQRHAGGLRLEIRGQVRGGKNNMGMTRTGKHYPKKEFVRWRTEAMRQVRAQLPPGFQPFATDCAVSLEYVAGDRRRRDFPAICDALWHVLERAGVVTDDSLLWPVKSSRRYDPSAPGVVIEIQAIF